MSSYPTLPFSQGRLTVAVCRCSCDIVNSHKDAADVAFVSPAHRFTFHVHQFTFIALPSCLDPQLRSLVQQNFLRRICEYTAYTVCPCKRDTI